MTQSEFSQHVKTEMVEAGMTQVGLSRVSIMLSTSVINYICQGKRPMRVPMACELEKAGCKTASYWMQLQDSIEIEDYKSNKYYRNGNKIQ